MSSPVNRRQQERHTRRLKVHFWPVGQERAHTGFTTNVSVGGIFLTTEKPLPKGTRLRLELALPDAPVVIEAVVAHGHRVPPALRRLGSSGMGVRFLSPGELVASALPTGEVPKPAAQGAASPVEDPHLYSVRYESMREFRQAYERDLKNGGLFVITNRPSRLNETVTLELYLPTGDGGTKLRTKGRVVQVLEPRGTATGSSTTGGMGVELLEVDKLVGELAPLAS